MEVRDARVGKTPSLQVADEPPQHVVGRRGDDDDHVAQLERLERPDRPARPRGKSGEGHEGHPHAGRGQLRGCARASRAQRRLRQYDTALRRELVDPHRIPVVAVVMNQWFGGQLGQRHGIQAREPVPRGRDDHDLLTAERLEVFSVRVGLGPTVMSAAPASSTSSILSALVYSFRSSSTSGNRRRQARSTGTRTHAVIVSAHAIRMRPPAPAATRRPAITARSAAARAIRASAAAASPAPVGLMPRGSRSMTGVPSSRSIAAI